MADPAYAFSVAIGAALQADPTVTGFVGPDGVVSPLDAAGLPYPLVEIGNDQVQRADDGQCYLILAQVDVWSLERTQTKQIGAAVSAILAPDFGPPTLQVAGFNVLSALFHASKYLVDGEPTEPDKLVSHGVLQFRFELVPLNA